MSKTCINCGRILSSRAFFCSYCGLKTEKMNVSELNDYQQKIRVNRNISPSRKAKIITKKIDESIKMRGANTKSKIWKVSYITIGSILLIGINLFVGWMLIRRIEGSKAKFCYWDSANKHYNEYIDF